VGVETAFKTRSIRQAVDTMSNSFASSTRAIACIAFYGSGGLGQHFTRVVKAARHRKFLRSVKFLCVAPRERRFHTASRRGFEKAAQEILTF